MHSISSVDSSLVKVSHTSKVLKVSFGETIKVSHSCRNQSRDYKIAQLRNRTEICNHKFNFRPELNDTKCNFNFIVFILNLQAVSLVCRQKQTGTNLS